MSFMFKPSIRKVDPALTRATLGLTAAFWVVSYLINSTRGEVLGISNDLSGYGFRLLMNLVGAGLCWGGQRVILSHPGKSFLARSLSVTAFAICGAIIYSFLSTMASLVVLDDGPQGSRFAAFILSLNFWLWFFLAWAGMLLGLVYSHEAIERERELADAQISSHVATIRALRYQVNPHFLFNTLNAIASLVERGTKAERLILDLSNFFRVTLSIDPIADIPLAQEFEIQTLYLNIEKVRYGERLQLTIDLAQAARDVLVPSLILQPLVENAIKHGVSSARHNVEVALVARVAADGRLTISVRDNGAASASLLPGTGVGLENVGQRLRSRFGDAAQLRAKPCEGGGFEVTIVIDRPDHAD